MLHIINLLHLIKNDFYIFIRLERRKLCDFNKMTIIIHYISLTLSALLLNYSLTAVNIHRLPKSMPLIFYCVISEH